ncbi:copper resistance D family protein [Aeromicrobium sp. UC242_57]
MLTRFTLSVRSVAVALGLTIASLGPIALTGHAASSGSHSLATTSLYLHIVGATVWVGGLAALGWVAMQGSKRLEAAVVRYSAVALWAFVIVAVSGVVNAMTRLQSFDDVFGSSYGQLVIGKVVALVALGALGYLQRRRIIAAGGGIPAPGCQRACSSWPLLSAWLSPLAHADAGR